MTRSLLAALLVTTSVGSATVLYQNTFDDSSSLDSLVITGGATVSGGRLMLPFFEGGSARLGLENIQGYSTILSDNPMVVSFGFNLEIDQWLGGGNPGAELFLSSTTDSPLALGSVGYSFRAGNLVGNRTLFGYSNATQNLTNILVDIPDGLPNSPSRGSFRLDYDPATSNWSVYSHIGPNFVDPTTLDASDLAGSAADSSFTGTALPYLAIEQRTARSFVYLDNLTVRLVPEPRCIGLLAISVGCLAMTRKRRF